MKPFYMSETPITNQQYVTSLNENLPRVVVSESEVYLDDRIVLRLSEKIRDYRPIKYENGRFTIKDPMHTACAILSVTATGAEAYARHYDLRLPYAHEWAAAKQGSGAEDVKNRQPSR